MPVKRRNDKRRIDRELHRAIWTSILEGGYDFFRELGSIGVATDDYGKPDRDAAAEAWAILGPTIAMERRPDLGPTWAEREFGRPWETAHAD